MIDRRTIPYRHWSHKISRRDPITGIAPDVNGQIVFGVDDLDQAIITLVLTPKRSVPTNPEKGCDLSPHIDSHPAIGVPNMTREIWDALSIWETRIIVDDVRVVQVAVAHWLARILWHPIQTVLDDIRLAQQTEVTIRG